MENYPYSQPFPTIASTSETSEVFHIEGTLYQASTIGTLIISGIGLVANTLIIFVIAPSSLRTSAFMPLLMFLAIADNVCLLSIVALRARAIFHIFVSSLLFCRLINLIYFTAGIVSIWLLVFISLERFIAIFFPLNVNIFFTMKRTYAMILTLTISGLVSATPLLFTCSNIIIGGRPSCSIMGSDHVYDLIFAIVIVILYSIIPFIIITSLNIMLVRKIKAMKKFRQKLVGQHMPRTNASKQTSPVPMMVSICVLFALTRFPSSTYISIRMICKLIKGLDCFTTNNAVSLFLHALNEINHAVNFFFYCLTGSLFRKTFFQLIRCRN